jgi:hypothetical protein
MNAIQRPKGRFVKDGVRYHITPSEGKNRAEILAEAVAAGYSDDRIGRIRLKQKDSIAAARYEQEMGGFQLPPEQGGMYVRTDARNRTLLNAAALRATADPDYEVLNWKTAEGTFITLTNATILHLNGAVEQFIAGCFSREKALNDAIDTASTTQEINAIAWQ